MLLVYFLRLVFLALQVNTVERGGLRELIYQVSESFGLCFYVFVLPDVFCDVPGLF